MERWLRDTEGVTFYMPPDNRKPQIAREEGIVEESLPGLTFRVRMFQTDETVLAHLAGRLKLHRIRALPGDRVLVEVSDDRRRGRIVRRL